MIVGKEKIRKSQCVIKLRSYARNATATRALIYDGIAPYKGKEEHCVLSAPLEYK